MFDYQNTETSKTEKTEKSLQEIEESLKVQGNEEKYHKFRSFLLLYPKGTSKEWENFSSQEIFESFSKLLDALPVCTITILCRRHFSELPFFLNFFDRSPAVQLQPKSYLPYLCHKISNIPIQWVVQHILKISDIRYAYQFLTAAFKDGITINSNQQFSMENQSKIWTLYLKVSKETNGMSVNEAWEKMTQFRSLMKQLLDFKLSISLSEFRHFNKGEFVRRQLSDCSAPKKYQNLLPSLMSFAISNSVDIQPYIISTLCHREWPVQQKLDVVRDFIFDKDQQTKALALMTFKTEEELEKIRTYASNNGIGYEPLPDNYINMMNSSEASDLNQHRSFSNDCLNNSGNEDLNTIKSSLNGKDSVKTASRSLAELANGKPSNPKNYASKLKEFTGLKEIAPIVALANFGVVVSYEKYSNIQSHKEILKTLIQNNGYEHFSSFCKILKLSNNDIVSSICIDELIPIGDKLIPIVIPYVTKTSSYDFVSFADKVLEKMAEDGDPSIGCKQWLNWINSILDLIDSQTLVQISLRSLMMMSIVHVNSSASQKKELFNFMNRCKNENLPFSNENFPFSKKLVEMGFQNVAEIACPSSENFSAASFADGYASNDLISFATSLYKLCNISKNEMIEYVTLSIPKIPGRFYSRLLILYEILKHLRMNYSKEMAVLQILFYSNDHDIDFHNLNKDPKKELLNQISKENIWDFLPFEKWYKIEKDTLLLHVIINKMKSSSYEDYKMYIAHLDNKKSKEILIEKIPMRLNSKERIQFFQGIGCNEIRKKEETEYDLKCYGLDDYIRPEFLQNPSKLILELYSKLALHERLGETLHALCTKIANRYDKQINRICEHLLEIWLNEDIKKEPESDPNLSPFSIYTQTLEEICERDDETNIQKVLFILRTWKPRNAAKWLISFILQTDSSVSYRARLKAITCLFVIADKDLICDALKSGNFNTLLDLNYSLYYASRLELFGLHFDLDDFSSAKTRKTINKCLNSDPGALRTILELCIEKKINDRELLHEIISKLVSKRKRFLLRTFNRFFLTFPDLRYDSDFVRFYVLTVSAPIDEMISQQVKTRIKPHHLAVIRDLFDSIASESIIVDYLIIDGKNISWAEVISQICSSGMTVFAADLGAHIVGNETRKQVLFQLLNCDKYDDALFAGFDKEMVFNFIIENDLTANATNMFVDEHFVLFTAWLKKYHHEDEIEKVKEALRKQRRTKEISRMESRLAKQSS